MKKKILLIRPHASARHWAQLLSARGFDCIVEPLLRIEATGAAFPDAAYQAVLFTSSNGVEALRQRAELCARLAALPCFCVGETTAASARAAGFAHILHTDSDGAELARAVSAGAVNTSEPLLHICGECVDGRLQSLLSKAGFAVTPWPIYRAVAADDMTPALQKAIAAGTIDGVPFFSPRSARLFISLIEKNRLVGACARLSAVALSQAIADVLQTLPWRRIHIAASPRTEDVLACLEKIAMTDSAQPSAPPPVAASTPAQRKTGHNRILWACACIILLSLAGTVAVAQCPWMRGFLSPAPDPQIVQHIDALENRVRMLESDQKKQSATAPAPAPATADPNASVNALADSVKTLQAQVAQLQNEQARARDATQRTVAAAFALWNLHSAVDAGSGFSAPLAALQNALDDTLKNDTGVTAALATLFTYAAGVETLPQLHDDLAAHEPDRADAPDAAQAQWQARLYKMLHSLISIHPLHSPVFDRLENALATGDGHEAAASFDALPEPARAALGPWHQKLAARLAVDEALRDLATRLAVPADLKETAP